MKDNIYIGIIESNRLLRDYLTNNINLISNMKLAYSYNYLDQSVLSKTADVVILNSDIFNKSFLHYQANNNPDYKLIIINADSEHNSILKCIKSGATGFVLVDTPVKILINVIREVYKGEWFIPNPIVTKLCKEIITNNNSHLLVNLRDNSITARELQIIKLIINGLTNKEIACDLNIAVDTVKCHVHNILDKLKLRRRTELMRVYDSSIIL